MGMGVFHCRGTRVPCAFAETLFMLEHKKCAQINPSTATNVPELMKFIP